MSAAGAGVRCGLAAAGVVFALLLAGCIVVPRTREAYDPDCRIVTRQVTLEATVLGSLQHCHGQECAGVLAALGVVAVASAVVSGSIAVVGNVVYWIERQGRCRAGAPPDAPPR